MIILFPVESTPSPSKILSFFGHSHWLAYTLQHWHITRSPVTLSITLRCVPVCGRSRDTTVLGTTEPTLLSKDCARARQQSSHGVGDSYVLYALKSLAELEVEMERGRRLLQILREQCRVMRMTLFRERKGRISEREMPQTRSVVSKMVCIQGLFLHKGRGDLALPRPDGGQRLGALLLP